MKPKNLKCPFKWADRRPLIFERVLFVPEYYQRHTEWRFPGWEDPALFGNAAPIFIEYCTGNGAWILQKALNAPQYNWVAVEQRFDRVRKIWSKIQNYQLPNLIAVCGEALTFNRFYLPADCAEAVYINFPDPWPKGRHAKHRLLQAPFIAEIARVVKRGGTATIVTDDPPYCGQVIAGMHADPNWQACFAEPYFSTEWPDYGTSYFDELWRAKGLSIRYTHFKNIKL